MPLDPQAEQLLKAMASAGLPPLETLSPPVARAQMEAMRVARGGAVEAPLIAPDHQVLLRRPLARRRRERQAQLGGPLRRIHEDTVAAKHADEPIG